MQFGKMLSVCIMLGIVSAVSIGVSAIDTTDNIEYKSENFFMDEEVAMSLFLRGFSSESQDIAETPNMISLLEVGAQATACLSCNGDSLNSTEEAQIASEIAAQKAAEEAAQKAALEKERSGNFYLPDCPLSKDLQQYIYNLAIEKDIPVDMMFTVPFHESNYNPNTISSTNDYGLYQINICNHKYYSKLTGTANKPLDPYINTLWGATILQEYLERFEPQYDDFSYVVDRVLSCYNGGPASGIRNTYLSRYDKCHKIVVEWMTDAGYSDLIEAY